MWFGGVDERWDRATLEGGDVLVVGNGAVLIGMGERTTPVAVELLAEELFRCGAARRGRRRAAAEGRGPTCTSTRS